MRADNLYSLPEDLPVPQDDGACDHLRGAVLPSIALQATSGVAVDLSKEGSPWVVVYCYPRTGRPDQEPLGGVETWNAIPGARGCTPQSCAYRDHYAELRALGATVYGLSKRRVRTAHADTASNPIDEDRGHIGPGSSLACKHSRAKPGTAEK